MANLVQAKKKIALLHRYPVEVIKETNAAFPFLQAKGIDVLTFKTFDRLNKRKNFWKSLLWIFYGPMLVFGKGYDVIYCDDSYPFYGALVKIASPKSRVILRIGDLHLMYYYSGWVYRFLHFFEKIAWMMADNILPISKAMGEYIGNEVTVDNINVVLDPVNPEDFPMPVYEGDGTVMFHGVLTKNKKVDILLEAARRLPAIDFTIVGDGPDLKRLKRLAPYNVFFTGWVPFKDISKKIAECSVGVALRSDNPGNQYVVTSPFLQYGIMGKPCLVTRRKAFTNYHWQFSTINEFIEKLKILLKNGPCEGVELRNKILEYYDAKKIGEKIWELLQA